MSKKSDLKNINQTSLEVSLEVLEALRGRVEDASIRDLVAILSATLKSSSQSESALEELEKKEDPNIQLNDSKGSSKILSPMAKKLQETRRRTSTPNF